MNGLAKLYQVNFTSDGIVTTLPIDCSVVPISEDFKGNQPNQVISPKVTSVPTGDIANVTADLDGVTVTFTFENALDQNDINGNLILYTASFWLRFPN